MNRPLLVRAFGTAAAVVLIAGVVYYLLPTTHRPARLPLPVQTQTNDSSNSATRPAVTPIPPSATSALPANELKDFAKRISAATTPEEARNLLAQIRGYLAGLPKETAIAVLRNFLAAQDDAVTKLQFSISADGSLKEAPTLRVWLLECFGLIDRQAAADFAKNILGNSASPDEWAVSLRDFARVRTSPEDVAFIQSKVREMIGRPDWLRNPSAGFLEAFDTIVYTHDSGFTPDLARLVADKDNRAAAHAAYLTLDRLIIQDPATVLTQLENNPQMMQGREQTRANYFARADVGDPQQRALLENYLLDPTRSPQELQTFAGLYPNANYMLSNNLLTQTQTPTHDDLVNNDRAALTTVEKWMADPRFANLQPQLQQIHARLGRFVQQAKAAGS